MLNLLKFSLLVCFMALDIFAVDPKLAALAELDPSERFEDFFKTTLDVQEALNIEDGAVLDDERVKLVRDSALEYINILASGRLWDHEANAKVAKEDSPKKIFEMAAPKAGEFTLAQQKAALKTLSMACSRVPSNVAYLTFLKHKEEAAALANYYTKLAKATTFLMSLIEGEDPIILGDIPNNPENPIEPVKERRWNKLKNHTNIERHLKVEDFFKQVKKEHIEKAKAEGKPEEDAIKEIDNNKESIFKQYLEHQLPEVEIEAFSYDEIINLTLKTVKRYLHPFVPDNPDKDNIYDALTAAKTQLGKLKAHHEAIAKHNDFLCEFVLSDHFKRYETPLDIYKTPHSEDAQKDKAPFEKYFGEENHFDIEATTKFHAVATGEATDASRNDVVRLSIIANAVASGESGIVATKITDNKYNPLYHKTLEEYDHNEYKDSHPINIITSEENKFFYGALNQLVNAPGAHKIVAGGPIFKEKNHDARRTLHLYPATNSSRKQFDVVMQTTSLGDGRCFTYAAGMQDFPKLFETWIDFMKKGMLFTPNTQGEVDTGKLRVHKDFVQTMAKYLYKHKDLMNIRQEDNPPVGIKKLLQAGEMNLLFKKPYRELFENFNTFLDDDGKPIANKFDDNGFAVLDSVRFTTYEKLYKSLVVYFTRYAFDLASDLFSYYAAAAMGVKVVTYIPHKGLDLETESHKSTIFNIPANTPSYDMSKYGIEGDWQRLKFLKMSVENCIFYSTQGGIVETPVVPIWNRPGAHYEGLIYLRPDGQKPGDLERCKAMRDHERFIGAEGKFEKFMKQ